MDKQKLEDRRKAKKEQKNITRIEKEKNQKPVNYIKINIEWKDSRTYGSTPHCSAKVSFKDGSSTTSPIYTTSGCGYDKESTVVADVFNAYLKYKLWKLKDNTDKKHPYGISTYKDGVYFDGGIGINCYDAISTYINGKFERIATGNTFDVYTYTDNEV